MKISKLFHWLYCAVMFLPLFVLPIFALAVRSDNNFSPISIQREETVSNVETYTINQLVSNGRPDSLTGWDCEEVTPYIANGFVCIDVSAYGEPSLIYYSNLSVYVDHVYFLSFLGNNVEYQNVFDSASFSFNGLDSNSEEVEIVYDNPTFDLDHNLFSYYFTCDANYTDCFFYYYVYLNEADTFRVQCLQLFDLTAIFGVGNEPTQNEFIDILYDNRAIDSYVSSSTPLTYTVDNGTTVVTVTYSDTDFGSQTIYTLYKEVDTYFNYDNVFNFGDLYTWLVTNFFNGAAPLGFFIFWHLLIYWLLTSLLWLLFDVLLYVPNLIHRWLDKASIS